MSKYVILGAGLMGRAIAKYLLDTECKCEITLTDIDENSLIDAGDFIKSKRVKNQQIDLNDTNRAIQILAGFDVVISALPHRLSLKSIKLAIQAKVSCVDLVGEAPEERLKLNRETIRAGITIIPGMGVAPGLSNICVGRGVELLDETFDAMIYVGGIPKQKTPPLNYQTVYALKSVFKVYKRPARIIQGGKEKKVPALSGLETIKFPKPIGNLEAFYTDGLASLILTMKEKVKNSLGEKTLRYPGYTGKIKFLRDCGLLELGPVQFKSQKIVPLDFLVHLLSPKLHLQAAGDWLAMRIVVSGKKDGEKCTHIFELIDEIDLKNHFTAMARTTAFPAVIAAKMITSDLIREKGVLFPEIIFTANFYEPFISKLASSGIIIKHEVTF